MASLNRTMIGLKVVFSRYVNEFSHSLNRTMIGLKDYFDYCTVNLIVFESNYDRIERLYVPTLFAIHV